MTGLTPQQISEAGLADWHGHQPLTARFETGDFSTGLEFVNAVGAAAEEANHHPDVLLTYPYVDLTLMSHDVRAITERDISLAKRISALAAERGLSATELF